MQHMGHSFSQEAQQAAREIAGACFARRARALARSLTNHYDQMLKDFGLTVAQLNLLVAIVLLESPRAVDLSGHLGIEKSTLSRNLSRMQKNGWVLSQPADSARGHRLVATSAGLRLLKRVYPHWQRAQDDVRRQFGTQWVRSLGGCSA